MKRRGFMGLLGGGLVSAPSMAKAAVAQAATGLGSLSIPGMLGGFGDSIGNSPDPTSFYGQATGSGKDIEYDHGAWLTNRVKDLAGISADDLRERMDNIWVDRLDPDLAVNRSFSLAFKLSIQRERNYERSLERERRQAGRDLTEWLKRQL